VGGEEHRPVVGHQGSSGAGIFSFSFSIWCVFVDVAFDGNLAGRVPAHHGLTTLQSHARSVILIAHTSDQKPPSVLSPILHTSTTIPPNLLAVLLFLSISRTLHLKRFCGQKLAIVKRRRRRRPAECAIGVG